MKVWRHRKSEGVYYEIGRTIWETFPVVIYVANHDHRVWVREELEFDDGRFEFLGLSESVLNLVYPLAATNESNLAPLLISDKFEISLAEAA